MGGTETKKKRNEKVDDKLETKVATEIEAEKKEEIKTEMIENGINHGDEGIGTIETIDNIIIEMKNLGILGKNTKTIKELEMTEEMIDTITQILIT